MNKNITSLSRLIALVCSLGLVAVIFLPIWRIELSAPQYPEGLVMKIYSSKLGGDVDVVNGLNHYIGMRTLHEKDFVEFQVLPYIIGLFVLFGLLAVLLRRKWFFFTWVGLYVIFAVTAMIDFYRWEYNYGHNLDPTAPIQVPGQSYQPPLIGYKQLLNFGAYSIPDTGGWIFIGVALLLVFALVREVRKIRIAHASTSLKVAVMITALFMIGGCSRGPEPIKPGVDACDFCKMTITDTRFGGEILTKKGRVYKFDDMHCLVSYMKSGAMAKTDISGVFLCDYDAPGSFIKAEDGWLLQSDAFHSPMGGNMAAFRTEAACRTMEGSMNGARMKWNDLIK